MPGFRADGMGGRGDDGMLVDEDFTDADSEEEEAEAEEEEILAVVESSESSEEDEEEEQYEGPFIGDDHVSLQNYREGAVGVGIGIGAEVDDFEGNDGNRDGNDEMIGPKFPPATPASPDQPQFRHQHRVPVTVGPQYQSPVQAHYRTQLEDNSIVRGAADGDRLAISPLPVYSLGDEENHTVQKAETGQMAMDIDQTPEPKKQQQQQQAQPPLPLPPPAPTPTPTPAPAGPPPKYKYGGPDIGKGYEAGFHWPSEIRKRARRDKIEVQRIRGEGVQDEGGIGQATGVGEGMDVDVPLVSGGNESGYAIGNGNGNGNGIGISQADHVGSGSAAGTGRKKEENFDRDLANAMSTPTTIVSPPAHPSSQHHFQTLPTLSHIASTTNPIQNDDFSLHFNLGFLMRFTPDFEQLKRRMRFAGGGLAMVGRSLECQAREQGWGVEVGVKGEVQVRVYSPGLGRRG